MRTNNPDVISQDPEVDRRVEQTGTEEPSSRTTHTQDNHDNDPADARLQMLRK
jgi:hypothetical protein